jgi:hypothetical protein
MGNNRSASVASLIGWLATAVAVAVIPAILISERDRSPYFWHRVAWTEFLVVVVWGYFSGFILSVFPGGRKRAGMGGILPATGVIVTVYATVSFLLMVFSDWPNRFHWAGQVILLLLVVLLFVFFEYARTGAVAGTEPIPQGMRSPAELCAIVRLQEERLWSCAQTPPLAGEDRKLHDSLKALREAIQYSIQHVGRVGGTRDYATLAADVERTCDEIKTIHANSQDAPRLRATVEELHRRVDHVSANVKVQPP